MPELPEVETIAVQLNGALLGRVVKQVVVYREKNFEGSETLLVGKKVTKVSRRAKIISFEFDKVDFKVSVHLKMTGQLIYTEKNQKFKTKKKQSEEGRIVGGHPSSDWVAKLPSKHTRVEIIFEDGSKLFFNDMRGFGWVRIVTKNQKTETEKNQIPDVVDEEFSLDYFEGVLSKARRPIKIVLLDQQLVGGMGNIYVNDALNLARILPTKKAVDLTRPEVNRLYDAVRHVIDLGIKSGGASAANYVDTKGLGGTYQNHFLTYKRDGLPCKNCGEKIVKMKLGGRGTFYCPNCQV